MSINELHLANNVDSTKIIYLVSHGWHAGIVLNQADIPDTVWRESQDFPNAKYLEIGWGDKDYYQTPNPHLGIAIKAILWPTPSVLHIVGFNKAVTSYFPSSEIIEVRLSNEGFERMIRYIAASHYQDPDGISKPIAKGLYGNSQFYLSGETYHLFKTCNAWTAEALLTAGCPIRPAFTITVEGLMSQIRSFGAVIQKQAKGPERLDLSLFE
ncbi:DUF2459 domain-containing protein [Methyloprofundus sedimenti]|nr:DUF2459 domain-containing protein [Methyloprofundus sedimenti]